MKSKEKIQKALRTKAVYVEAISGRKLDALNAKGFTVIFKPPKWKIDYDAKIAKRRRVKGDWREHCKG